MRGNPIESELFPSVSHLHEVQLDKKLFNQSQVVAAKHYSVSYKIKLQNNQVSGFHIQYKSDNKQEALYCVFEIDLFKQNTYDKVYVVLQEESAYIKHYNDDKKYNIVIKKHNNDLNYIFLFYRTDVVDNADNMLEQFKMIEVKVIICNTLISNIRGISTRLSDSLILLSDNSYNPIPKNDKNIFNLNNEVLDSAEKVIIHCSSISSLSSSEENLRVEVENPVWSMEFKYVAREESDEQDSDEYFILNFIDILVSDTNFERWERIDNDEGLFGNNTAVTFIKGSTVAHYILAAAANLIILSGETYPRTAHDCIEIINSIFQNSSITITNGYGSLSIRCKRAIIGSNIIPLGERFIPLFWTIAIVTDDSDYLFIVTISHDKIDNVHQVGIYLMRRIRLEYDYSHDDNANVLIDNLGRYLYNQIIRIADTQAIIRGANTYVLNTIVTSEYLLQYDLALIFIPSPSLSHIHQHTEVQLSPNSPIYNRITTGANNILQPIILEIFGLIISYNSETSDYNIRSNFIFRLSAFLALMFPYIWIEHKDLNHSNVPWDSAITDPLQSPYFSYMYYIDSDHNHRIVPNYNMNLLGYTNIGRHYDHYGSTTDYIRGTDFIFYPILPQEIAGENVYKTILDVTELGIYGAGFLPRVRHRYSFTNDSSDSPNEYNLVTYERLSDGVRPAWIWRAIPDSSTRTCTIELQTQINNTTTKVIDDNAFIMQNCVLEYLHVNKIQRQRTAHSNSHSSVSVVNTGTYSDVIIHTNLGVGIAGNYILTHHYDPILSPTYSGIYQNLTAYETAIYRGKFCDVDVTSKTMNANNTPITRLQGYEYEEIYKPNATSSELNIIKSNYKNIYTSSMRIIVPDDILSRVVRRNNNFYHFYIDINTI